MHPGGAYMHYVIERIHEEGLYKPEEMSDEMKEHYIQVAQQARDAKLNAGAAKTSSQRLIQGSARNELIKISERVRMLVHKMLQWCLKYNHCTLARSPTQSYINRVYVIGSAGED
jgi:hypothetical protein